MKLIRPVTLTDSVLTSSNVPETDFSEWDSGTTYAVGDKVISTTTHRIYEALLGSTGVDPTGSATDPATWLDLGATNRWKAFDQKISDKVSNLNTIEYELTSQSVVDGLVLFNLAATDVNVTVTDSSGAEVYNETVTLTDSSAIVDWYTYFFEPPEELVTELQFLDLPPYFGSTISITITNVTGTNAEVGQIVFGSLKSLGATNYGTSVTIEDYSRKETDAFGNFIVVERNFAQLADFDIQFDTIRTRDIQKTLASYRSTPIVYIGADDPEYATTIYGFYRRFDLTLQGPSLSFGAIEVEGLT